jgi:hypothetical protein
MTTSRKPLTSSGNFRWIDIPAAGRDGFGVIGPSRGTFEITPWRVRTYAAVWPSLAEARAELTTHGRVRRDSLDEPLM